MIPHSLVLPLLLYCHIHSTTTVGPCLLIVFAGIISPSVLGCLGSLSVFTWNRRLAAANCCSLLLLAAACCRCSLSLAAAACCCPPLLLAAAGCHYWLLPHYCLTAASCCSLLLADAGAVSQPLGSVAC